MGSLLLTSSAFLGLFAFATALDMIPQSCLNCICQASTKCDAFANKCFPGANGAKAGYSRDNCGPYELSKSYWAAGGELGYNYETCANMKPCAERVILNYMKKAVIDCNGDGRIDCLDFAAVHHFGPDKCKEEWVHGTEFWQEFQKTTCYAQRGQTPLSSPGQVPQQSQSQIFESAVQTHQLSGQSSLPPVVHPVVLRAESFGQAPQVPVVQSSVQQTQVLSQSPVVQQAPQGQVVNQAPQIPVVQSSFQQSQVISQSPVINQAPVVQQASQVPQQAPQLPEVHQVQQSGQEHSIQQQRKSRKHYVESKASQSPQKTLNSPPSKSPKAPIIPQAPVIPQVPAIPQAPLPLTPPKPQQKSYGQAPALPKAPAKGQEKFVPKTLPKAPALPPAKKPFMAQAPVKQIPQSAKIPSQVAQSPKSVINQQASKQEPSLHYSPKSKAPEQPIAQKPGQAPQAKGQQRPSASPQVKESPKVYQQSQQQSPQITYTQPGQESSVKVEAPEQKPFVAQQSPNVQSPKVDQAPVQPQPQPQPPSPPQPQQPAIVATASEEALNPPQHFYIN